MFLFAYGPAVCVSMVFHCIIESEHTCIHVLCQYYIPHEKQQMV